MIFGDFNFDILLTVLDGFNFLWSIFFGGVTSYKGCLYTKYILSHQSFWYKVEKIRGSVFSIFFIFLIRAIKKIKEIKK